MRVFPASIRAPSATFSDQKTPSRERVKAVAERLLFTSPRAAVLSRGTVGRGRVLGGSQQHTVLAFLSTPGSDTFATHHRLPWNEVLAFDVVHGWKIRQWLLKLVA